MDQDRKQQVVIKVRLLGVIQQIEDMTKHHANAVPYQLVASFPFLQS